MSVLVYSVHMYSTFLVCCVLIFNCTRVLYWLQVFYPGHPQPVFYVANRGHHADIGGITPGEFVWIICTLPVCLCNRPVWLCNRPVWLCNRPVGCAIGLSGCAIGLFCCAEDLFGCATGLSGYATNLFGCVTGLSGYATGLSYHQNRPYFRDFLLH